MHAMKIKSIKKIAKPQIIKQLEHSESEFRLLQASMAKLNDIVVITEVISGYISLGLLLTILSRKIKWK